MESYDSALELNSNHVYTWNNKGNIYRKLDNYKQALDCYNRALELNPESRDALFNKGITLELLDRQKMQLNVLMKFLI